MDVQKPIKPLGGKAYGSIPHLPGSRLGIGDHHCHPGQAVIACERIRDKNDLIIVQEKLDGSNCSVAKLDGKIVPVSRAGYLCTDSPHLVHRLFYRWVLDNSDRFDEILQEGERICGEFLGIAHGTIYEPIHEPFVAFDIIKRGIRAPFNDFKKRIAGKFVIPHILSIGGSFSIDQALSAITKSGHGAVDGVEGAIWRVERKGVVDFLTKFVRHEKEDGKYFAERNNGYPIFNLSPPDKSRLLDDNNYPIT